MPKTIIDQKLADKAKEALLQLKQQGVKANRLKAIIAAYNHGIKKVSEVLDVDRTSIHRWANKLDKEGSEFLSNKAKHKEGIILKNYHKEQIRKWVESDPNVSRQIIWKKLKDKFGIEVSLSTVRRAMKDSGFSYITPRKNHYKQDREKVENFKKKSPK
jgi:transposase